MHSFKAKVIPGRGRGGKMGFPTANLAVTDLPIAYGAYLAKIRFNRKIYHGLLHYGPKKTFNEPLSAEVHIINFNRNIYGRTMEIEVGRKIRRVRKFANMEALRKQIKKDLRKLKKLSKKVEVRSKET